ncbi:gamma-glutamyl-gamma-aminobutyrate hydrolase family protein [Paraburkholderia susongensis]|uniref:Gamma-glutamyl-gamma-aminobutyrate hydrolase PuuD (Putrescine degradation), contains GATase1-like domain n=1 Tax=Paraburkholderia susongensis TaxID=1515439 RepID=A0A1X7IQ43_9BURK|nr:type 1 glutamine amidotransferase [Paraburkholderia susongensis]SMG16582.1 Gamma-glutamyl-gamma-aminobutyrate hydrolase PuuD (putrescine degradation), contains GATase1-like domain [Paraburkholderia susongensis]
MSENKPENAGTAGSPPPASGSPAPSGTPKSGSAPLEPAASSPPPHEDAIRLPESPARNTPSLADEKAAAMSSTDDPISASTVTPEAPQTARQRDAAEARSAAAASTAQQEAAVHEREARRAGTQAASARATAKAGPAFAGSETPVGTATRTVGTAGASAAATDDVPATQDAAASTARPTGAPPPGFGAAPDFSATNPPPPNAFPPSPPRYLKQNDSAWSVFGRIIAARARQLFDRAGQRITQRTLRIGVSARIFHPEPGAKGLRGKTLQYLEESIAHWVMSRDVIVFMIPTVGHQGMLHPSNIRLRDYAKHLDGLLLQGGSDVSPQSYAETATSPEWPGDRVRDMYELELLHEFIESGKPVLGVCRGCQLINVAFGGTLYQDIATDVPTAGVHVSENYDQHRHGVHFPDGSTLLNMFPGRRDAIVNSIHHQAVKTLGRDLNIEAVSAADGIIEAVRYRRAPFVMGVQWHPEFHRAGGPELLDCTPLLDTFLRVARETRF